MFPSLLVSNEVNTDENEYSCSIKLYNPHSETHRGFDQHCEHYNADPASVWTK